MTPRARTILAVSAGVLLLAALVAALVWALALQPAPPRAPLPVGGLPDSSRYSHAVVVLTNIGYLSGYCEAHRNPAWVGFSVSGRAHQDRMEAVKAAGLWCRLLGVNRLDKLRLRQ